MNNSSIQKGDPKQIKNSFMRMKNILWEKLGNRLHYEICVRTLFSGEQ